MLSNEQLESARPQLRVLLVIPVAMLGGALMFGAVVSTMADWSVVDRPMKIFNLMAAGTSMLMYVLAFLIPTLFPKVPARAARSDGMNGKNEIKAVKEILGLMTSETIIRYAILEGGVFLNIVVVMLETRWISIVMAGLGIALMLLCLPIPVRTAATLNDRFDQWRRDA